MFVERDELGQFTKGRTNTPEHNALLRRRASEANRTHGFSGSPTYQSWMNMRRRCNDANHRAYHRYGGRGITVCDRWSLFENFLADMGVKPTDKTLDRVDNDGNYEPSNCRWATWEQQCANRITSIQCISGHSTTIPGSFYINPTTGTKHCRECMRNRQRRYRASLKAAN